jgi:hypothetical protein
MRLIQRFINKNTELSKRFHAIPTPCKHLVERTALAAGGEVLG